MTTLSAQFREEVNTTRIRIAATDENGLEMGRIFLFLMKNDKHEEPWGYVEDLFVEEEYRKHGVGTFLMQKLIETAKERGCYKLLATSRNEKEFLHKWYIKLGFTDWGKEFRLNLK